MQRWARRQHGKDRVPNQRSQVAAVIMSGRVGVAAKRSWPTQSYGLLVAHRGPAGELDGLPSSSSYSVKEAVNRGKLRRLGTGALIKS